MLFCYYPIKLYLESFHLVLRNFNWRFHLKIWRILTKSVQQKFDLQMSAYSKNQLVLGYETLQWLLNNCYRTAVIISSIWLSPMPLGVRCAQRFLRLHFASNTNPCWALLFCYSLLLRTVLAWHAIHFGFSWAA